MPQVLPILSNPAVSENDFASWLGTMVGFQSIPGTDTSGLPIELTAQRGGCRGNLDDHPSVEQMDELLSQTAEHHCRIHSLFIPFDLRRTGDSLGEEISAIDGWIDLASYAEIDRAVFHLIQPSTGSQPDAQYALEQTFDYAIDLDIAPSICIEPAQQSAMTGVLEPIQAKYERSLGLDWRLEQIETGILQTLLSFPFRHSIRIPCSQSLEPDTLQAALQPIRSSLGDTISEVTFVVV